MSLGHGPSIVRNGLVFYLDAANQKSYDSTENLQLQSQTFDSGSWNKYHGVVNANTDIAPDGTQTADELENTFGTGQFSVYRDPTTVTLSIYTYSCYVKSGTQTWCRLQVAGSPSQWFDLTAGVAGAVTGAILSNTITDAGNGWWRCSVTFAATGTTSRTQTEGAVADGNLSNLIGATILIWGAQLELGSAPTAYYATEGTNKVRGTTLTDMTNNGWTGTVSGNTTFLTDNKGTFDFDGTSTTYISTSFKPAGAARTLMFWINHNRVTSLDSGNQLNGTQEVGAYTYIGITEGGNVYYFAGTSGGAIASTALSINTWYQQCLVIEADGRRRVYTNDTEILNTTGSVGSLATAANQYGAVNNNHKLDGQMGPIMQYNRALTAEEVAQNFNALKGRFPLPTPPAPPVILDEPFSGSISSSADSLSVGAEQNSPTGIDWSSDGMILTLCGQAPQVITTWDAASAFTLAGCTARVTTVAPPVLNSLDGFWGESGSSFYHITTSGASGDNITRFNVSTPYDLTTQSSSSVFSVGGTSTVPTAGGAKPDGTKFYIGDNNTTLYQFSFGSAWTLSGSSYDSVSLSFSATVGQPRTIHWTNSGSILTIVGSRYAEQFTLSTAYDLTTAISGGVIDLDAYAGGVISGCRIVDGENSMYVTHDATDTITRLTWTG